MTMEDEIYKILVKHSEPDTFFTASLLSTDFRTVAKEIASMYSHHLGTGKTSSLKEGKTKGNVKQSDQTES